MTITLVGTPDRQPSLFDDLAFVDQHGVERWSARALQPALGYDKWERFEGVIDRAKASAANVRPGEDHFPGAGKMIEAGKGASRQVVDIHLSRFGAYLVAMNGDPRKPEIAAAQTYFAVATRAAETGQPLPGSAPAPVLPQDYLSALKALTAEVEARQAAEALQAKTEVRALTAERDLTDARPSQEAWDRVFASRADWSMKDAAGALTRAGVKIGPRQLGDRLIEFGWAFRSLLPDGSRSPIRPYAEATKQRLVCTRPLPPREKGDTGEWFTPAPQLRITGKGLAKALARLAPHAPQLPMEANR